MSLTSFMKKEWLALWENRAYLSLWIFLLVSVLLVLKLISVFLVYNDARVGGVVLNDVILGYLEPQDVSTVLFSITWVCIFICLPIALRTPQRSLVVFISILIIGLTRCICMYFVHLEPPQGIIPLRDTLLECSFYENKVLVKDLFFSGHTANLALLVFLVDIKWIKIVLAICTFVVAFLLLKQHVHYTIDVVAAPFFAYGSYRVASLLADIIHTRLKVARIDS